MIGALVAGITGSGGASLSSYESIATATGTGSSGTVSFTVIPTGFKHLQIRYIARSSFASTGANPIRIQFNSDTGANYAHHYLRAFEPGGVSASGSTGATRIQLTDVIPEANDTNIVGAGIVDILDYGSTTKNKTVRGFAGFAGGATYSTSLVGSGVWLSTSAITRIDLIINSQNWLSASSFALYGIKESA